MFADNFDPATVLASIACSRCRAVGLVETDMDTVSAALLADRHRAPYSMGPSVPARCPACGSGRPAAGMTEGFLKVSAEFPQRVAAEGARGNQARWDRSKGFENFCGSFRRIKINTL